MKYFLKNFFSYWIVSIIITGVGLTACQQKPPSDSNDGKLTVVATTTIVGDIVAQVGGDMMELSVLLPVGIDPHSFDPSPKDIAQIADAEVVFANGAGLEEFLEDLISSAAATEKVVHLSEGIDLLAAPDEDDHDDQDGHPHEGGNPHTWTNPENVLIWVDHIAQRLGELDPHNAEQYLFNAAAYKAELTALDGWIQAQVAQVPVDNRKLVTDHALFGYFAQAYGFEQIGALIPGYSTLAEPTAQELAQIEDAIQDLNVKAVFVGNTVNPALAERVAADTNTQLIYVFTGSLSEMGGEADTYLDYMRYNTTAFVNALK